MHYGTTELDPHRLHHADPDLRLFCQLHLPTLRVGHTVNQTSKASGVHAHTTDALTEAAFAPTAAGIWPVIQRGSSRLWDTIETAAHTYDRSATPRPRDSASALWTIPRGSTSGSTPGRPLQRPLPI